MKIESFLLSSTLQVIIAQRLVRRICQACRFSTAVSLEQLGKLYPSARPYFSKEETILYQAKGCGSCSHTGYKGQIAVFEMIEIGSAMQDLILKTPSPREVWQQARIQGTRSLFEDGIGKVENGVTTLSELLRVVQPPRS